jgi:NAD kinase
MNADHKIILVTRRTRLAELVVRFNTVSQAKFYIEHLGADFSDYLREDAQYHRVTIEAEKILSEFGRVQKLDRGFLPNFIFGEKDLVIAIGQDGLVANTVKYLHGQLVIGVNPDPARWDGKLLPFNVGDLKKIVPETFGNARPTKSVTMAKAALNNGQILYAVNDLFIGPKSHVSARYSIEVKGKTEQQSSSGVIVSTGLGSTGWFQSLLAGALGISRQIEPSAAPKVKEGGKKVGQPMKLQDGFPWESDYLYFTVREPFPSRTTSTNIVFGKVTPRDPFVITSQMPEHGVIFSDGIEADFLEFNSGTKVEIGLAERKGVLVV